MEAFDPIWVYIERKMISILNRFSFIHCVLEQIDRNLSIGKFEF